VTLTQFVATTTIVAVGAALQGTIGFGLALFAAPLLLFVDPRLVPGPMLGASGLLTLLMARREWHGVQRGDLAWALGGRLVGTAVALGVLGLLTPHGLDLVFGGLVILAVLLTATGRHPRPAPGTLLGAGALSGFMGTTTSIGGPAMALVYQGEPGPRLRGTLAAFFVVGVMASVAGLALVGRFGAVEARLTVLLLPGIVIGYLLSRHTMTALDRGLLRPAVLVVCTLAGLAVILRRLL